MIFGRHNMLRSSPNLKEICHILQTNSITTERRLTQSFWNQVITQHSQKKNMWQLELVTNYQKCWCLVAWYHSIDLKIRKLVQPFTTDGMVNSICRSDPHEPHMLWGLRPPLRSPHFFGLKNEFCCIIHVRIWCHATSHLYIGRQECSFQMLDQCSSYNAWKLIVLPESCRLHLMLFHPTIHPPWPNIVQLKKILTT